jgi:thiamine biosynthesis protein ThiS
VVRRLIGELVTREAGRYRRGAVQVTVNDEPRALPDGATVADLVTALALGARRIAVEVNRAVVPRAAYLSTTLRDGDAVEVIHFVGGG